MALLSYPDAELHTAGRTNYMGMLEFGLASFLMILGLGLTASSGEVPYEASELKRIGVVDTWKKYDGILTWGKGQCLAILDDGCDLTVPEWKVQLPWGKKVIAGYDSIDHDNDPSPVPPGYHGTSVGYPSSYNFQNKRGVAYNDFVAHVRAVTIVHLRKDESRSLADGLQWVIDHHKKYNITAVNLSPVDDQAHAKPRPTVIDAKLSALRRLGIWVSAPCGNNEHTTGPMIKSPLPRQRIDEWSKTK